MALMSERGVNLQQGEGFTLYPSTVTAAVAGATGTPITLYGERLAFIILLDVTNCDTDATDTLDVYVDVLISGTKWINAVHFTQRIGTDGAVTEYATLNPGYTETFVIVATADAAVATVRPGVFGSQMRARWTIVDGGGAAASFTFAVAGYAL